MKAVRPWLVLCALGCCGASGAGEAPTPAAAPELARSSLLTLNGVAGPPGLQLWLRRTAEPAPLVVTAFGAAIDGRGAPATRTRAGGWSVPVGTLTAGEHRLAVIVGHDGIRELLEGKFTSGGSAAPAASAGPTASHKQLLWWLLNIGIVLVAAIAISRRVS